MFENLSHEALQQYWWIIISLLAAALVFLLFVQGLQSLVFQLGKTEKERTLIFNTSGRKWELSFTTLVTFGGAFFASFPLFYSTSFGGAYWVWMIILFTYIVQAVSYEYRSKTGNFLGSKVFETFLMINGYLAPLLIGVAVGTFFTGSYFSVDEYNLSRWENPYGGLEAALNITNVALGLAVLFLSRVLGIQYLIISITEKSLIERARKQLLPNTIIFLVAFLLFVTLILVKDGFALDAVSGLISMEPYKYFHNLLQMPFVIILFLAGVLLVLYGIAGTLLLQKMKAIWFTGSGTILTVLSLFFLAGFNNTSFYPSTYDLQSSLTIFNSSSSHYTLTAMSYVSLFVPVVIAYIWYVWRAMDKHKMNVADLENDSHLY